MSEELQASKDGLVGHLTAAEERASEAADLDSPDALHQPHAERIARRDALAQRSLALCGPDLALRVFRWPLTTPQRGQPPGSRRPSSLTREVQTDPAASIPTTVARAQVALEED